MGKVKDKLYYYFANKNWGVNLEYEPFVDTHEKYKKCRLKRLWLLLKLNFHYRVLRKKTPMLRETIDRMLQNAYQTAPAATKNTQRYPYLSGSESEAFQRTPSIIVTRINLLKTQIVSFDIFDTLILRPFATPQDLFYVVGNKLGIMDFKNIRIDAEKFVRSRNEVLHGNREVTIYDIYEEVSKKTGISVELGVKTEFETEKEFCFANPYMMQVFKILKDQGKQIIIASDMYLPHDMMVELLESCGYTGYSKLYVSCDYRCSKRSGGLYTNILNDFNNNSIVHIGDNYQTDILKAEEFGIETYHYKNCHEIGNRFRAENMSGLIGSLYAGIVNTHLHNGTKSYNPHYEYGFTYGGLYVTGYCSWIYKKAKEQGVDKILFLARDGDVYQKVFNIMFNDMPNEYVYWSRIANLKYTAEYNRADFIKRIVNHKAYNTIPLNFKEVLDSFDLGKLADDLKEYNLSKEQIFTPELITEFEKFIISKYDTILDMYESQVSVVEKVFRKIVGKSKRIAIVDVGWLGSGPIGLKWLIEKKWKLDCKVSCYLAASTSQIDNININELMNNVTETYMFSNLENKMIQDIHKRMHNRTNNIYFEFFTQACHPTFSGFTEKGEYVFSAPETTNYNMTKDIQSGIVDFSKSYLKFAKNNPYLLNISGHDAYMPYKFVSKSIKLIKMLFDNATYSRNVGVSLKSQKQETISDICKKVKVNV